MTQSLHDLLSARWSPRAFADRDLEDDALRSLLEAARWSASCFNEQPWRFIIARRADAAAHATLAGVLVEKNRAWAARAPVLMLTAAATTFAHNGKPNRHAWHDVGLAVANLTVQATHLGIGVHQMGGFDPAAARAAYAIPAEYDVVSAVALGYFAAGDQPPQQRARRPVSELAFEDAWGTPARVLPSSA